MSAFLSARVLINFFLKRMNCKLKANSTWTEQSSLLHVICLCVSVCSVFMWSCILRVMCVALQWFSTCFFLFVQCSAFLLRWQSLIRPSWCLAWQVDFQYIVFHLNLSRKYADIQVRRTPKSSVTYEPMAARHMAVFSYTEYPLIWRVCDIFWQPEETHDYYLCKKTPCDWSWQVTLKCCTTSGPSQLIDEVTLKIFTQCLYLFFVFLLHF